MLNILKKSNALIVVGLSMLTAIGLFSGLSINNGANKVEAGTTRTMYLCTTKKFDSLDNTMIYMENITGWPGKKISSCSNFENITNKIIISPTRTNTTKYYKFDIDCSAIKLSVTYSQDEKTWWNNQWGCKELLNPSSTWNGMYIEDWGNFENNNGETTGYTVKHVHKVSIVDGDNSYTEYNIAEDGKYYLPTHTEKSGYEFLGWKESNSDVLLSDGGEYAMSVWNWDYFTFTAQYRQIQTDFDITFETSDERHTQVIKTLSVGQHVLSLTDVFGSSFTAPPARYFLGWNTDTSGTFYSTITITSDTSTHKWYAIWGYEDANLYSYSLDDGNNFVNFTNHTGQEGFLQVYTSDAGAMNTNDHLTVYRDGVEITEAMGRDYNVDSNVAANGRIRFGGTSNVVTLQMLYDSTKNTYTYRLSVTGMPTYGLFVSVNGVLYDAHTYDTKTINDLEIKENEVVKMYDAVNKLYYNVKKHSKSEGIWTVKDGLICGIPALYKIEVSESSAGNWDTLKFTYLGGMRFVVDFNTTIGGVCDWNGNTNRDNLKARWNELKTQYNNLSLSEKSRVDVKYTYDPIPDFFMMYDYVFPKYYQNGTFTEDYDFLHKYTDENGQIKLPQNAANRSLITSQSEDQTILIIIISSVSLLTLAGASLLIIKKRKH